MTVTTFRHEPVAPILGEAAGGAGIQRTMRLLATSTPERRHRVRILVYGQSFSAQEWWREVRADLERRFPHADLVMENRAIGGFASQQLIHTLGHDVFPFYPDLVIFRVLGDHYRCEDIIAAVRRHTTAEMLIWSGGPGRPRSEVAGDPAALKGWEWGTWYTRTFLAQMAAKYGCEFADTAADADRYVAHVGMKYLDFVISPTDGHWNDHGNWLFAELIKRRLVVRPELERPSDAVTDAVVGRDARWDGDRLELRVEGNRVDLVAAPGGDGTGAAEVWIDGRRPSDIPELCVHARCGGAVATGWPLAMRLRNVAPLVPEVWSLRLFDISPDVDFFRFEVRGSVTGPDGAGDCRHRFVSRSRRLVIEPDQWSVKRDYDLRKVRMPEGYEVTWRTLGLFADRYAPPRVADPTREDVVTVAQGLPPGPHRLELKAVDGRPPALGAIRVYRPPFAAGGLP